MSKKNAREKLMQELLAPEYRLKCEYAIHILELKLEMLMEQFYVECGRPAARKSVWRSSFGQWRWTSGRSWIISYVIRKI